MGWGEIQPVDVDVPHLLAEHRAACDELHRLRAWKAEATEVIRAWEQVWEALGRPGRLGESKAAAVLRSVESDDGSATPGPTRPDPSLTERQVWGSGSEVPPS